MSANCGTELSGDYSRVKILLRITNLRIVQLWNHLKCSTITINDPVIAPPNATKWKNI